MINLDPERQILQGVYTSIVNNEIHNSKPSRTYIPNAEYKRINNIKIQYKQDNNKKLGRNDLCPCGSRKKFKHCCGKENQ